MKKNYTWVSPYQQQKFLNRQKKKIEERERSYQSVPFLDSQKEKVIAILLDVQGTLDNLDDEKAKMFMQQVHLLRKKFQANKAILNVSSHLYVPRPMIPYLEILHRNLLPNIVLDDATYLYGTYHFETGEEHEEPISSNTPPYNYDKISVFKNKYFPNYDLLWFAIIDDTVHPNCIKEYKDYRPMILCRPSQNYEGDLKYDNLMCHSSLTEGFDGVLECLQHYIEMLQPIRKDDIVRTQQEMLLHLGALQVTLLCYHKEYDLLLRYVLEDKLDKEDYEKVALMLSEQAPTLSTDDLEKVRKIFRALVPYLGNSEILKKIL